MTNSMIAVDLLLAASRNGAGSGHLGRNVTADTIDAARQIAGRPAARFLFEGRRRLHVHLHHVRAKVGKFRVTGYA